MAKRQKQKQQKTNLFFSMENRLKLEYKKHHMNIIIQKLK